MSPLQIYTSAFSSFFLGESPPRRHEKWHVSAAHATKKRIRRRTSAAREIDGQTESRGAWGAVGGLLAPEDVVQLALGGLAELLGDFLAFALPLGDLAEELAQLGGDLARVEAHHA